jgi:hypothetical protein
MSNPDEISGETTRPEDLSPAETLAYISRVRDINRAEMSLARMISIALSELESQPAEALDSEPQLVRSPEVSRDSC